MWNEIPPNNLFGHLVSSWSHYSQPFCPTGWIRGDDRQQYLIFKYVFTLNVKIKLSKTRYLCNGVGITACCFNFLCLPILIHFLSCKSEPWAHSVKRSSGWSLCLLAMFLTVDFHSAAISYSKLCTLQYKWFLMPLHHCCSTSQPLCLLALLIFFC